MKRTGGAVHTSGRNTSKAKDELACLLENDTFVAVYDELAEILDKSPYNIAAIDETKKKLAAIVAQTPANVWVNRSMDGASTKLTSLQVQAIVDAAMGDIRDSLGISRSARGM